MPLSNRDSPVDVGGGHVVDGDEVSAETECASIDEKEGSLREGKDEAVHVSLFLGFSERHHQVIHVFLVEDLLPGQGLHRPDVR